MIQELIDIPYATDTRKDRRKNNKNGKSTSEYFTPYSLIKKMADKTPRESWADTTKTFIDPCFGSGNILLYIIWNRIQHGIDWHTALSTCYGDE